METKTIFFAFIVFSALVVKSAPFVEGERPLPPSTIPPHELNDKTFEAWRAFIHPSPKDKLYESIPWRASLWQALIEGQTSKKPILMYVMNGHPCGST